MPASNPVKTCTVLGQARHCPPTKHLVFVPVDGRLVFFTCLVLILACLVWLGLLLHKGVKFEESS